MSEQKSANSIHQILFSNFTRRVFDAICYEIEKTRLPTVTEPMSPYRTAITKDALERILLILKEEAKKHMEHIEELEELENARVEILSSRGRFDV